MESLGFTEGTMKWFKSYLLDRKQRTDFMETTVSGPCKVHDLMTIRVR